MAELIQRAETEEGDRSEAAKKEAADLILRLWEMREKWPKGGPMRRLEKFLRKAEPGDATEKAVLERDDWLALMRALDDISDDDENALLDAFTSRLDLAAEEQWMVESGNELSEREQSLFNYFKSRQARLRASMLYQARDSKSLFDMSDAELRGWIKRTLEENQKKRLAAIKVATRPKRRPVPKKTPGFVAEEANED